MIYTGIVRQTFLYLGGTMFLGYICWRSVEGTDNYYKTDYDEKKKKEGYDSQALILETLKRGGASDLSKLRERTAELRQKIAEENTTYNVPRDGKE